MDKVDEITINIQCQGEDGLINFLYKHGVAKKKDGWMLSCPVMKLTNKSKTWVRGECSYLEPTDKCFTFFNEGHEAILGLRFYFPIKIHKADKLEKQDEFLVLELMKGNRENLFLAHYDFDKKRYYPTNIKFKRGFENSIDFIKYMLARLIKQNWIKGIISAGVGVVLAVVFSWPYIFIGVSIFVAWVSLHYIRTNCISICISIDSVPLDLKQDPPSPQPLTGDQLKSITR